MTLTLLAAGRIVVVFNTLTVMSASLLLLLQEVSGEAVSVTLDAMVEAIMETEVERTVEVAADGSSEAMTLRAARTKVS